jgi:hypothetical protein
MFDFDCSKLIMRLAGTAPVMMTTITSMIALMMIVDAATAPTQQQHSAVLMSEIPSLTFTNGRLTTARRNAPVPQLKCIAGSCEWQPRTVLCTNMSPSMWPLRCHRPLHAHVLNDCVEQRTMPPHGHV